MKYEHKEETHNLKSPGVIAPLVYELFQPKSVIDIGCGVGTFLYAFKKNGVKEVLGLDGDWTNKDLLAKYLTSTEFKAADLSKVVNFNKKFDLAICLELAEHLDEKYADNLVQTLINASNIILFSAASPYQMGQHHVNEQWPDYWIGKFLKHNFNFYDLLRPVLWNHPDVDFWYKQNMFLIIHKDHPLEESIINEMKQNKFNNMVHPDAFIKRSKFYLDIIDGKMSSTFYFRLLIKGLLNKMGINIKSQKYR